MNRSAKLGLGVGAAVALLLAVALMLGGGEGDDPTIPGAATGSGVAAPRPGGTLGPERTTAPTPSKSATGSAPTTAPTPGADPQPRAAAEPAQLLVRGRVVLPNGAPVAKARVILWLAAPGGSGVRDDGAEGGASRGAQLFALRAVGKVPYDLGIGSSGAGGAFSIGPIAIRPSPGARLNLTVEAWGETGGDTRAVNASVVLPDQLPQGGVDAGDLVIKPVPVVRFLVRARGVPLQGAGVQVFEEVVPPGWSAPYPRPRGANRQMLTNAQGRAWHNTGAPRIAFSIRAKGYATEHGVARTRPQGVRVTVDLEPEARVEGVVLDAEGRPYPSARLRAYQDGGGGETGFKAETEAFRWVRKSGEVSSDADGRFALTGMGAKRTYWVYALPSDGSEPSLLHTAARVTPPATDLQLTLARAATLTVEARLPPSAGRPARISFVLQRKLAAGWQDQFLQHVGPQQPLKLTFARIPPGTLRVALHARGYAPVVSEPLEVRADQLPPPLTLALESRGRSLEGRVTDQASRPLPGAMVVWRDFGVLYAVTDGEGRFALADLPVEPLVLTVRLPGYQETTIEVPAGTTRVPSVALQAAR